MTDVIELHAEVIHAAALFFNASAVGASLPENALRAVHTLPAGRYHIIVLDVFSGGTLAPSLETIEFFKDLKRTLWASTGPVGVLAVNWYGRTRGPALHALACKLAAVFRGVRCFSDKENSLIRNHVLFASDGDGFMDRDVRALSRQARQTESQEADGWDVDYLEGEVMGGMAESEIELPELTQSACAALFSKRGQRAASKERAEAAIAHWRTMREQFGDTFWGR